MKKTSKSSLPKAQLGTILKSTLKGAVKGGKAAYKAAKTTQLSKRAAAKASTAAKKAKGYGDSGQYARLEDMKRSEFYRDRRNAGKTYSGGKSRSGSPISSKEAAVAGAMVTAGAGSLALMDADAKNKKKVRENKKKVEANRAKYKMGTGKYKFADGGSSFGMLSVKAGIDKNPKPTAADRIAGAKMNKKKMGGVTKLKKK